LEGHVNIYPGEGTEALGISGNSIVGAYLDASDTAHGFLYNMLTENFTTLDDPLAEGRNGTYATGISGNNIIGFYYNSSGIHGFLYDGSTWTTIDEPNAVGETFVEGISGNTLVGWYSDSSDHSDGFIATIVPEPSTVTLLCVGAIAFVGYGLRRRRQRRLSVAVEDATAAAKSPAILSFPCRSFEAKRRAE
jgi:hypothetical protein